MHILVGVELTEIAELAAAVRERTGGEQLFCAQHAANPQRIGSGRDAFPCAGG